MECDSMRAFVVALVFTACDAAGRPSGGMVAGPGIEITSEPAADADGVRLDLPGVGTSTGDDLSTGDPGTSGGGADLGAVAVDLGGEGSTSTGEGSTSTGEPGSTSTGEASTSGTSSTGEPPAPDFCGDGACTGAETEPACWGAGFCPGDCLSQPKCLSDCPCAPGTTTFCNLAPGTCSATKPGGYCDPNGDGAYFDGDFTKGNMEHAAKCG